MCAYTSPSKKQNAVQYAKPNAGNNQGTLSGVSLNLLSHLICPLCKGTALKGILPPMGSWILDSGPGFIFSAITQPTPLFALQDICREGTKG